MTKSQHGDYSQVVKALDCGSNIAGSIPVSHPNKFRRSYARGTNWTADPYRVRNIALL